jgi:hypothetical protein
LPQYKFTKEGKMKTNRIMGLLASGAITLLITSSAFGAGGAWRVRSNGNQPLSPQSPQILDTKLSFTYQGRLTDSSGAPVSTPVTIKFRTYSSGNAILWESANKSITPDANGLFTAVVGDAADPSLTTTILESSSQVGLLVNGVEMNPKTALRSVFGRSDTGFTTPGVFGVNANTAGVGTQGDAMGGYGVVGNGGIVGVVGSASQPGAIGVSASGYYSNSIALAIGTGGISVDNAGVNSKTPVFIHTVKTSGTGTNTCGVTVFGKARSIIDNPLTNGNPNAILIVTPNYGKASSGGIAPPQTPVGVYYADLAANVCGAVNKWVIYDLSASPAAWNDGARFNVMVIVPTPLAFSAQ